MAGCLAGSSSTDPPSLRGVAASGGRILRGRPVGQVHSPVGRAQALNHRSKSGPREVAAAGQDGEQHHHGPALPVELAQGQEDPVVHEFPVQAHSSRCGGAHAQQQVATRSNSPERFLQASEDPKQAARKASAAAAAPAHVWCPCGTPARSGLRWPIRPGSVAPWPRGMVGGHMAFVWFAQKAGNTLKAEKICTSNFTWKDSRQCMRNHT